MPDVAPLRAALAAAGLDLPADVVGLIEERLGPLLGSLDALVALDLADVEPFSPRRLADDAAA